MGVPWRPGKSQKGGQEDQREVKDLGGASLGLSGSPVLLTPGLPSRSSLASLELDRTSLRVALISCNASHHGGVRLATLHQADEQQCTFPCSALLASTDRRVLDDRVWFALALSQASR